MGNKRNTIVFVNVDTCGINEGNKNEKVTFSDNRRDRPGRGNIFKSKVNGGKNILWVGRVKEAGKEYETKDLKKFYEENSVEVKQIEIKNGEESKVLKNNYYYDVNNNGVVKGKIKKSVPIDTEDAYDITILVNGSIWLTIDPRLYMK